MEKNIISDLIRQIPNAKNVYSRIQGERNEYITQSSVSEPLNLGALEEETGLEGLEGIDDFLTENVAEPVVEKLLDDGARALEKISNDGEDADLDDDEAFGLEAIVHLEGRPAILIQDGRFFPPPNEWQHLEDKRDDIQKLLRSVGRIEVEGHPSFDWIGTGFLVAHDVVMTNRHVAEEFCKMGYRRRWKFKTGMKGRIDYIEELASQDSAEFEFRSVIGVHEDFDLALFRVRVTNDEGTEPPEPLTIASSYFSPEEAAGHTVFTIGYPAWDGRRNDPEPMQRIFANIFNVKRLQPGEVNQVDESLGIFVHDCSTLGGNSGSPVFDLETMQVVGLHYGGRYLRGNKAVALWMLTDDPLLKRAKINFHVEAESDDGDLPTC